jgi:hypothetical protein
MIAMDENLMCSFQILKPSSRDPNPEAEAEEAIIEQVKDETNANVAGDADEPITTTDNDGSTEADDNGAAGGAGATGDETSTGTGRKLISATTRLASAALRMFGI